MIKLSDYVINHVVDLGIRHIFMLPGGGAMHLVDSVGNCKGLEFVCNIHEQASAIAAEAYARVTNNIGVALVTTGPGGTNAITGVAAAWLASTPCLIVSGQVKRADMKGLYGVRTLGTQELDIVSIVKSITKYATTVTEPSDIRYHLEKAVYLARSGRKGPVWIDIPLDIQASLIDSDRLRGFIPPIAAQQMSHKTIKNVIQIINQSERPVLLAGNGVHFSGAKDSFIQLIELLQIPVLTTWAGCDLLPFDHRFFMGKPGTLAPRYSNFTIQNCDCLVSLGARLDFDVTGFNQTNFARAAKTIIVDIDSAEFSKFKFNVNMPICADVKDFINGILDHGKMIERKDRTQWLSKCEIWKQKYPVVVPEYWKQTTYINSFVFADTLSDLLSETDLIIPGSSGAGIDTFWLAYKSKKGQRAFSTGGLGSMGFGIPASIGGCLAHGKTRTITIEGDGGFHMNAQELKTVARLNLPIKYFVLNNGGYGSIRNMQKNHFKGHLVACDASSGLSLPDTVKVAQAYGIKAIRIDSQTNLREQIKEVLNFPGPIVCDVMIDPNQVICPRVSSAVRPDGTMISKPLEDMWPFLERDEFLQNMLIEPLEE